MRYVGPLLGIVALALLGWTLTRAPAASPVAARPPTQPPASVAAPLAPTPTSPATSRPEMPVVPTIAATRERSLSAASLRALDAAITKAEKDGADPATVDGLRARRAHLARQLADEANDQPSTP